MAGKKHLDDFTKGPVREAMRAKFRPEILNRIDENVIFESLRREDNQMIIDVQLARSRKMLEEKRLSLELTESALRLLADRGYDPVYGARPLKRAIQKYLLDPLALRVLNGEFLPGDTIVVEAGRDEIRLSKKARA